MKSFALFSVLFCLGLVACERHEFEGPNGTKQLHEHHGADEAHDMQGEHSEEEKSH